MKIIIILLGVLNYSYLFSQSGNLDLTFNTYDKGQYSEFLDQDLKISTITIQKDGKILIGGDFSSFNGTIRNRIARLNSDGSIDSTFNIGTGFNQKVSSIRILQNGKILVGGYFTSYNGVLKAGIVRLNVDGTIDNTFNIGSGFNKGVHKIELLPSGKIFVVGSSTTFNGSSIKDITLLNSDGTLDNTFNVGTGINKGNIYSIALQLDNKIIVGGSFTSFNGNVTNGLVRLNTDGTYDNSFNFSCSGKVSNILIQSDNKILVGGFHFTSCSGVSTNCIVRLNSDGTIDETFQAYMEFYSVDDIEIQKDGKLIIYSTFFNENNIINSKIVRLNKNGDLDTTFILKDYSSGQFGNDDQIVLQSDEKVLIYSNDGLTYGKGFCRVNTNGSYDPTFNNKFPGANNYVSTIATQKDQKTIIGGFFNYYNDNIVDGIARLNIDGSLDTTFKSVLKNNVIDEIGLQDNKLIVKGMFHIHYDNIHKSLVRLNDNGSYDSTFQPDNDYLNWVRTFKVQSDKKIIVTGFPLILDPNKDNYNYVVRLKIDGSLDSTFKSNKLLFDGPVSCIEVLSNGKILVGGYFSSFNGVSSRNLIQLNADGTIDKTFNIG